MPDSSIVDPRIFEGRCCMCPNSLSDKRSQICPASGNEILHPKQTPCRFVREYIDKRGWKYRVASGIGDNTYKARYWTPDGKHPAGRCMKQLPWRDSFDKAQIDLNKYAEGHGFEVLSPDIDKGGERRV